MVTWRILKGEEGGGAQGGHLENTESGGGARWSPGEYWGGRGEQGGHLENTEGGGSKVVTWRILRGGSKVVTWRILREGGAGWSPGEY